VSKEIRVKKKDNYNDTIWLEPVIELLSGYASRSLYLYRNTLYDLKIPIALRGYT